MVDDALQVLSSLDSTSLPGAELYRLRGELYLKRNQSLRALDEFRAALAAGRLETPVAYCCSYCSAHGLEWAAAVRSAGSGTLIRSIFTAAAPGDGTMSQSPRKAVLDTSLFVNPDVRFSLGATPTEALANFLALAAQTQDVEFYMPPSTFQELLNFVNENHLSGELLVHLRQRPPKRFEIPVPGYLLYELVEEWRDRSTKG